MKLNLTPNALYQQAQTLRIDKVATLIGENGSGKSNILQSIFEQKLANNDHQQLNVVCFSSGQNERYSKNFSQHLNKERRAGRGLNLECFYFDKSWSKLLVFLATALKPAGKVRSFLRNHNYVTESHHAGDDVSTTLKCGFKIDKNYISRVKESLRLEESGEIDTLRATAYFRTLDSFVSSLVSDSFEFEEPFRKRMIEIQANHLINVSFDSPPTFGFGPDSASFGQASFASSASRLRPEISFFMQAADNNYFIDKSRCTLLFNDGIELDQLSDGEYQLLFLYALIDLFDGRNTLFLFDEVDSHLHYKNIEKLWSLLHSLEGRVISTTHLLDSISAKENHIEHLKVVEKGMISEDNKIKKLISRLSVLSRVKSVEFEVCGKLPNIALLDDYNDWIIFTKLAAQKGLDINLLSQVHALKKASSCASDTERLGHTKIEWVKNLSASDSQLNTKKVFLICDRDEANPNWHQNGVEVAGKPYKDLLNTIHWPKELNSKTYLLAWKRREIKNYLLSHTALNHFGILNQINNASIAAIDHLQDDNPGDNDSIRRLCVKETIDPLINTNGVGLDIQKLQAYIYLIPPDEISEDITNMYNFIIGKL